MSLLRSINYFKIKYSFYETKHIRFNKNQYLELNFHEGNIQYQIDIKSLTIICFTWETK